MRGEGEWRVVRRRGVGSTDPERPLARQKYPNPRYYPKPQRTGKYDGNASRDCRSDIWDKRQLLEAEYETFFFNNIPEDCSIDFLKRKFGTITRVRDVFCPTKRDLRGKPFGFVRFDKTEDSDDLLKKLNRLWIGSYKVRVFKPRFSRDSTGERKDEVKTVETKKCPDMKQKTGHLIQGGFKEAGKSFAEALRGNSGEGADRPSVRDAPEDIKFQPEEKELEWLQNAYTGYVKSYFDWDEIRDEINSECPNGLTITSMGGNPVLIHGNTPGNTETAISNLEEWKPFWFEWMRPWKYIDVHS